MKDIPVFTADAGLATLILSEIQHSGRAYVLVRSVWTDPAALLEECKGFCRACGAEAVYGSWNTETLPAEHLYDMLSMTCEKKNLPGPERETVLVDLDRRNAPDFLRIYNACFRDLIGAATYGNRDIDRMLEEETGFLVRQDGEFAAVAEISRAGLEGIGVLPPYRGLGYGLALAALDRVPSQILHLKVADTNKRAMALYRRLGFVPEAVLSRWYRL